MKFVTIEQLGDMLSPLNDRINDLENRIGTIATDECPPDIEKVEASGSKKVKAKKAKAKKG